jgi:poly(A) polymerase
VTAERQVSPDPRLAAAEWLRAPATQDILAVISAGGGEARVVGGAVRNTLMERPVTDIDIATSVSPQDVMARAETAGFGVVPTGLAHGTVTVIAGHKTFEVTTLRRDVETHGRHATVAFTEDWSTDAHRRDFTINALYCDADGRVYDYTDGLADLTARRVRFIGRAEDRIEEDYLRILRFYRFTAAYADGVIDRSGHEACAAMQDGLDQISAERIRSELLQLLTAAHAPIVLSEMDEAGLLSRLLGGGGDIVTFARLAAIELANDIAVNPVRRLHALAVHGPASASRLRDRLRLSKAEYERLADLDFPDRAFEPDADELWAKSFLYRHGGELFRDGVLLTWARDVAADPTDPLRRQRLTLEQHWPIPKLPVSGKDVRDLGVPPGPEIGQVLELLDQWWMAAGFPDDAALVRARLAQLVNLKNE